MRSDADRTPLRRKNTPSLMPDARSAPALIAIGASAGGHQALARIIKDLPADLPAAVVVLVHLPPVTVFSLPRWLAHVAHLPVTVPVQGEVVKGGHIYVAPPGTLVSIRQRRFHIEAATGGDRLRSIDVLFHSIAEEYEHNCIGVILTGRGSNGKNGLKLVHAGGGVTVVQNPADAEHPTMPANAIATQAVDYCLNLGDIGPALDLLSRRNAKLETPLAASLRFLHQRSALLGRLLEQSKENEKTRLLLEGEANRLDLDIRRLEELLSPVIDPPDSALYTLNDERAWIVAKGTTVIHASVANAALSEPSCSP